MPKVSLNGINLHYYMRTGFPVLVMLHGLATNLAFWYLRVLPALRRDLGVLLFDLRGHGQSDMPPSGYTTAEMAEDLHALLNYLGINQAHLVGHSFGGAVALHYAVLYPKRVLSLTLADARIRCLQPSLRITEQPRLAQWQKRFKDPRGVGTEDSETPLHLLEALAESPGGEEVSDRTLGGAFTPGAFSPFGLSRGRAQTAKRWLQLFHTTSAPRDFERVAGLTVERIRGVHQPTLAIFGEYSPCLPSCRGLQENLPNCRMAIVRRAGHFHPVVRPLLFARAVQGFIARVSRQR